MRIFTLIAAMVVIVTANPCIAAATEDNNPVQPLSITLSNLQNKPIDILQCNGKPTIIVFFTSWSKICEEELKMLASLYKSNKEKGVNIIAVSFDKKTNELQKFAEKLGIGYEVLVDKKLKSLSKFPVVIIPTTFVLDKKGEIKETFVDYDENVASSIKTSLRELLVP